jgi:hypothetical protein
MALPESRCSRVSDASAPSDEVTTRGSPSAKSALLIGRRGGTAAARSATSRNGAVVARRAAIMFGLVTSAGRCPDTTSTTASTNDPSPTASTREARYQSTVGAPAPRASPLPGLIRRKRCPPRATVSSGRATERSKPSMASASSTRRHAPKPLSSKLVAISAALCSERTARIASVGGTLPAAARAAMPASMRLSSSFSPAGSLKPPSSAGTSATSRTAMPAGRLAARSSGSGSGAGGAAGAGLTSAVAAGGGGGGAIGTVPQLSAATSENPWINVRIRMR